MRHRLVDAAKAAWLAFWETSKQSAAPAGFYDGPHGDVRRWLDWCEEFKERDPEGFLAACEPAAERCGCKEKR